MGSVPVSRDAVGAKVCIADSDGRRPRRDVRLGSGAYREVSCAPVDDSVMRDGFESGR